MVFLSMICYIHQLKSRRNEAGKIYFWRTLSISKSIGKIITDRLTDRPQIANESFFMDDFYPLAR